MNFENIRKLRELTNLNFKLCQQALKESNDDFENALSWLKENSSQDTISIKKTDCGYIGVYKHHDGLMAALVIVKCETDFVARMPEFRILVDRVAMNVAALGDENVRGQYFVDDETQTIGEALNQLSKQTGERLTLTNAVKFTL